MRRANCAKVSGRPAGMVRSASQTLRWKDVPRISSAISSPALGEDRKRRILNISSFTARSLRMNTSSGKIFPISISSSSAFVPSKMAHTPVPLPLRATRTLPTSQPATANWMAPAALTDSCLTKLLAAMTFISDLPYESIRRSRIETQGTAFTPVLPFKSGIADRKAGVRKCASLLSYPSGIPRRSRASTPMLALSVVARSHGHLLPNVRHGASLTSCQWRRWGATAALGAILLPSSHASSAGPEPLGPREIQPIGGRDREQASKRQRGPSRFGWERPTTTDPKAQYSQRESTVSLAHWAIHPSRAAERGTEHARDFARNCEHNDRPDGRC